VHARVEEPALDDATLTQKVMSELFRDKRIPKGRINVNAENGVVLLRGEIEEPGLIVEIVERARRIGGVTDVENLLHLPGETAPRS
jgi:osmotically-inducible protein OsmY